MKALDSSRLLYVKKKKKKIDKTLINVCIL